MTLTASAVEDTKADQGERDRTRREALAVDGIR
jgi:hypothetical protein